MIIFSTKYHIFPVTMYSPVDCASAVGDTFVCVLNSSIPLFGNNVLVTPQFCGV